MKDGRTSEAFKKTRNELEPVESKVPKGFKSKEWKMLPYDEKLAFVRAKKDSVLSGLQSRMSSPVVSLICDLQDLEAKMFGQDIKDDGEISDTYLQSMKLKIELAKAIKMLIDKGVVRHEHVVKKISDDEVLDVDFEEIINGSNGDKSE